MTRFAWRLPLVLIGAGVLHLSLYALHPPDLTGDPARLGLHTWDFLQRGAWPFYIYHLFAPNPLIIWLQAIAFSLAGPTVSALHAVTLVIGVLCAGLVYIVAVTLFRTEGLREARRAGLLAGLSLPLVTQLTQFAHGGTEHILLPFFALLTVAALWRGLRLGRRSDFFMAGVALGLSQYGYIVARALPVAVAAAVLVAVLCDRELLRRWRGLSFTTLTASLIAVPQWMLFVTAPYTFLARTGQEAGHFIFAEPQALSLFGAKLWHQVLALGWQWESGYNPSGRGLLPALTFIFALLGLLVALTARHTPAHLFFLAFTAVMMLPDLITVEGVWPSATRLIGAMPLWMIWAGYGAANVWRWLEGRHGSASRLAPFVAVLVLAAGVEEQWHRAQVVLPRLYAEPGREWMSSLVERAEADYILAQPAGPILIPSDEYQRAPLAFALTDRYRERAGAITAPLAEGETVTVVFPADPLRPTTDAVPPRIIPNEWVLLHDGAAIFLPPLTQGLEPLGEPQPILASNGVVAANVLQAEWHGAPFDFMPGDLGFENGLRLAAYHSSALSPGEPLVVTLIWETTRPVTEDLQLFTQVLDRREAMVAGIHDWPLRGTYRLNAWRVGERVPLGYSFPIPADLPPGEYRLITGVFDIVHQTRLPSLIGSDSAVVARYKVPLRPEPFEPAQTASAEFGGMLRLRGYTVTEAGLRLLWQASRAPDFNYTLFAHALDAAGNLIAQVDTEPLGGQYPTSIWDSGETVMMEVPFGLPAEAATLKIGWYRWDTGARLAAINDGERLAEDALPLPLTRDP